MSIARAGLVLLIAAAPLGAQIQETIEVTVANVEVVVLSRDGSTVEGLGQDEFELFVDGRPTPISNFYASTIEETSTRQVLSDETERASAEVTEPPDAESKRALIYLDSSAFEYPLTRNMLFEHLEQLVSKLLDECSVCSIAVYSRRRDKRVVEITGATREAERIRRQLKEEIEIQHRPAVAFRVMLERMRKVDGAVYHFMIRREAHAQQAALTEVIGGVAGIPGRKILMLVSNRPMAGAVPTNLLESGGGSEIDSSLPPARTEAERRAMESAPVDARFSMAPLQSLADLANAAGVAVYPVIAGGLADIETVSAEDTGLGSLSSGALSTRISALMSGIEGLAHATGGHMQPPTNNFIVPMTRVSQELRSYYSLGYRAKAGERPSRIEVRVPGRKELRVRTRRSHSVLTEDALATAKAYIGGSETGSGGPIEITAAIESGPKRGRGKLTFSFPVKPLIWKREGEAEVASLTILLRALSDTAASEVVNLPLTLRREAGDPAERFEDSIELKMARGKQELLVLLHDRIAGTTSWTTLLVDE
ncbi:MAG TPA: VWA domain-containing protein [Thermoanaerobaculia bacterium]|nr:VWA domain-containing protein [Thermoanaerobaculia bacterium]